jgi:hypothetical protein
MMSRDVEPPFIQNERSRQRRFSPTSAHPIAAKFSLSRLPAGAGGSAPFSGRGSIGTPCQRKHHMAAGEPPGWRSTPTEGEMPKCTKAVDWPSRDRETASGDPQRPSRGTGNIAITRPVESNSGTVR